MVKVGQKVRFDPYGHIDGFGSMDIKGNQVTGTVVMVKYKHGWFSVAYGDPEQRTSFNFTDIGKAVTVCGK